MTSNTIRIGFYLLLFAATNSDKALLANDSSPGAKEPASPPQWYGEGVRPTEPRSPEEERQGFHLPPGFAIELVASEPAIDKPLNMAFDRQGRLWVTCTVEYPYPAKADQVPKDSIKVLSDTDHNGAFETATTFADKLNIPMGILPTDDGAFSFSIPNLWHLKDTDGDGVCDQRQVLLGPFDTTRDTHGMVNALRANEDGWIYACHGFNNQSHVTGSDGHEVTMHSGNIFRFRPDGSRIELYSQGQVNPFGMTIDRWGNIFTADCHSKPLTQVIRGGCYSSFGRPDDGLGFVPAMMDHLHGSTAISGLVLYQENAFPKAYQDQFFSGNVMTSRINRNARVKHGATFKAKELSDFLTSDDPWFRPVDLQIGPDGSLYIADFYNKIIGHYEVPLDHPERDRHRGRIWRVTYQGNTSDLHTTEQKATETSDSGFSPSAKSQIEALWHANRQGLLTTNDLMVAISDSNPYVRVHALRIAAERADWSTTLHAAVDTARRDGEALVVKAAIEAISTQTHTDTVPLLLQQLSEVTSEADPILRQVLRIAIRDLVSKKDVAFALDPQSLLLQSPHAHLFAEILLGAKSPLIGDWLLTYLNRQDIDLRTHFKLIRHAVDQLAEPRLVQLIALLRTRLPEWEAQQEVLQPFLTASRRWDGTVETEIRAWGKELADQWLSEFQAESAQRSQPPVEWADHSGNPWPSESRQSADGVRDQRFMSSLGLGESYTGTLRSGPFLAPPTLEFWIVGHDRHPQADAANKNLVRLIREATGEVLFEAAVPRNDVARQVVWDLSAMAGETVNFECLDRLDERAYAWLGVGRFKDTTLQPDFLTRDLSEGLDLAKRFLDASDQRLLELAENATLRQSTRLQFLQAWGQVAQQPRVAILADLLSRFHASAQTRQELLSAAPDELRDAVAEKWLVSTAEGFSSADQLQLARQLAKHRESIGWLLHCVRRGVVSAEILRDKEVGQATETLASDAQQTEIASLVAHLPPIDAKLIAIQAKVGKQHKQQPGDAKQGEAIFAKHCAICHQLQGKGALVGPQLDGAVVRSVERLLEDILFPDRNVDHAFRTTSFLLEDGTVKVGLVREESEDSIQLTENNGQVIMLKPESVEMRIPGTRSLMPSGIHDSIGDAGLLDLLTFLQHQKSRTP